MTREEAVLTILTKEPQKQKEILRQLRNHFGIKMTGRNLRSIFNCINRKFINGLSEYMIISNKNGCWLSKDFEEIQKYNNSKKHHALAELHQVYYSEKRLKLNTQETFEEFLKL